jgi:hypothetical protein
LIKDIAQRRHNYDVYFTPEKCKKRDE